MPTQILGNSFLDIALTVMSDYTPPVAPLLTYGNLKKSNATFESWPDYVQQLRFTADQVPAPIRLMTDKTYWESDFEQTEIWASRHAWRTLAQLKAVEVNSATLRENLLEDSN
jgi:hypothetical protein